MGSSLSRNDCETLMTRQQLNIALRAALMSRNVHQVRALLATYGLPAFANAVAHCSPRVAADALSLLPQDNRNAVLRHLPRQLCDSLLPLGIAVTTPYPTRRMRWGLLTWSDAAARIHA